MNEKDQRLADYCAAHGLDGVVIRRRSNAAWITDGCDFRVDASSNLGIATLVWTPRAKLVFTDNVESPRLRAEELPDEWELRTTPWWEPLASLPEGRFRHDFPDDPLYELRNPLTRAEFARARELGADAAETLERVLREFPAGCSELDVAARLTGQLRRLNLYAPVVLVAADDRLSRYRHPIPTDRRAERVLMAAICAERHGLIVSATRIVHFGPVSEDLRRRHEAVCAVDRALHLATKPGARWCDVLAEGQRVYRETGFADQWEKHHQGGPMGYECRDFKATPSETRCVLANQLVGWNPSITGTKSEDTILSSGEIVTRTHDWPATGARPDILVREAS